MIAICAVTKGVRKCAHPYRKSSTTAEPTHDARGYQAEDDVRAAKPWKHFEPWGSVIEALGGSRVVAEQLHVTVDAMSSQANQQ